MTAPRSPGRTGHAWRVVRAHVIRTSTVCAWCLQPLHPELPHRDPLTGKVNAWSTTVDHATPLVLGGDPLDPANLVAMHSRCNTSKGARPLSARPGQLAPLNTDREW